MIPSDLCRQTSSYYCGRKDLGTSFPPISNHILSSCKKSWFLAIFDVFYCMRPLHGIWSGFSEIPIYIYMTRIFILLFRYELSREYISWSGTCLGPLDDTTSKEVPHITCMDILLHITMDHNLTLHTLHTVHYMLLLWDIAQTFWIIYRIHHYQLRLFF